MGILRDRIEVIQTVNGHMLHLDKDAIFSEEGEFISIVGPQYTLLTDEEMIDYFKPLYEEGFIEEPKLQTYRNERIAYVSAKVVEQFQQGEIGAYLTMLDRRDGVFHL